MRRKQLLDVHQCGSPLVTRTAHLTDHPSRIATGFNSPMGRENRSAWDFKAELPGTPEEAERVAARNAMRVARALRESRRSPEEPLTPAALGQAVAKKLSELVEEREREEKMADATDVEVTISPPSAPDMPPQQPSAAGRDPRDEHRASMTRPSLALSAIPSVEGRSPWRGRVEWTLKFLLFAALIAGAVFGGQQVQQAIQDLRSSLQMVPLGAGIGGFIGIHFIRKMVPPLYFVFPVMTLTQMYLADRMGPLIGAAILQSLKLQDILHFVLMRRYFTGFSKKLLQEPAEGDAEAEASHRKIRRFMPVILHKMLQVMDQGWTTRVNQKETIGQILLVVVFGLSFGMDDFVNVFWFSTRSNVTLPAFSVGFFAAMAMEVTKTHIAMVSIVAVADTVQQGSSASTFFASISVVPWYEVMILGVTVGSATFVIQSTNIKIVMDAICARCCPGPWEAICRKLGWMPPLWQYNANDQEEGGVPSQEAAASSAVTAPSHATAQLIHAPISVSDTIHGGGGARGPRGNGALLNAPASTFDSTSGGWALPRAAGNSTWSTSPAPSPLLFVPRNSSAAPAHREASQMAQSGAPTQHTAGLSPSVAARQALALSPARTVSLLSPGARNAAMLSPPSGVDPPTEYVGTPPFGVKQGWKDARHQLFHNTAGTNELAKIVGLTGEDFENALSAFQEFDRDRDGMLNRSDIAYAMGLDLKEPRVGLAMNALDIDGKGNVDFKAFTIALCHLRAEDLSKEDTARFCYPIHKAQQKDESAGMDEDAFITLVGSHPERFEAILSLREQLQNIFIGAFKAASLMRKGQASRQLFPRGSAEAFRMHDRSLLGQVQATPQEPIGMDVDNCIISPMLKMQEWRGGEEEGGDSGGARGVGLGREIQGGGGRRELGGAKFRPRHSSNIECDVDADEQAFGARRRNSPKKVRNSPRKGRSSPRKGRNSPRKALRGEKEATVDSGNRATADSENRATADPEIGATADPEIGATADSATGSVGSGGEGEVELEGGGRSEGFTGDDGDVSDEEEEEDEMTEEEIRVLTSIRELKARLEDLEAGIAPTNPTLKTSRNARRGQT